MQYGEPMLLKHLQVRAPLYFCTIEANLVRLVYQLTTNVDHLV